MSVPHYQGRRHRKCGIHRISPGQQACSLPVLSSRGWLGRHCSAAAHHRTPAETDKSNHSRNRPFFHPFPDAALRYYAKHHLACLLLRPSRLIEPRILFTSYWLADNQSVGRPVPALCMQRRMTQHGPFFCKIDPPWAISSDSGPIWAIWRCQPLRPAKTRTPGRSGSRSK